MDLSPNDIRNHEFPTQMRGYDKDQVDSLLDRVATAMEELKQDNLKLSLEIDSVKKQLESVKQYEDAIKSAAIDARRNADSTVATAKEEAASILQDARIKAIELVGSRAEQAEQLNNQLSQLENVRNSYLEKLRELIQSHMDIVREIEEIDPVKNELPEIPSIKDFDPMNESDGIEVTDSAEMDGSKLETIAAKTGAPSKVDIDDESKSTDELLPVHEEKAEQESDEVVDDAVDSELADALSKIKSEDDFSDLQTGPNVDEDVLKSVNQDAPARPSNEWEETTRPADEVPPEFIPVENPGNAQETGRISTTGQANGTIDPKALASELDLVAAKFEEEMNRAESN